MSEIEDSTESLHEKIHEEAEEAGHNQKEKWILWVALFTALVSVLAALTGMLSAHHENESLLNQMKASDQWNFYEAKSIKQDIFSMKLSGSNTDTAAIAKVKKYDDAKAKIKRTAEAFEKETDEHLARHGNLARGITLFQITIAISAISILTRKKFFWYIGIVFALLGVIFLIQGVLNFSILQQVFHISL